MAIDPVKYVLVLIVVFGFVYLLFELFHKAYEIPDWLTPRLAAMVATFFVALYWMLSSLAPPPPTY